MIKAPWVCLSFFSKNYLERDNTRSELFKDPRPDKILPVPLNFESSNIHLKMAAAFNLFKLFVICCQNKIGILLK